MNSLEVLQSKYPRSLSAMQQTFFQRRSFGQTSPTGENDAGYMLYGLQLATDQAISIYGHKGVCQRTVDIAASAEIRLQWQKQRAWRRPAAALSTCICNLITERPQRLLSIVSRESGRHAHESLNTRDATACHRRGHAAIADALPVLPGRQQSADKAGQDRCTRDRQPV